MGLPTGNMGFPTEEEDAKCWTQAHRSLREFLWSSLGEVQKFSWSTWIKFGTAFLLVLMVYCLFSFNQLQPGLLVYFPNTAIERLPAMQNHGQENQVQQSASGTRTAICLMGGLQAFELTGPSIQRFLLNVYGDADVFVHAHVDKDVHKLTILSGTSHLAGASVFTPHTLNVSDIPRELLTSQGSPDEIQELLQYFNLVEGCKRLIEKYEDRYHLKYDWVVRARVDGYWNSPMPPIESFDPSKYYVPHGSSNGGLNDSLGVGTRKTSMVALQRLSLLPRIHQLGFRHLNSESSFEALLKAENVTVAFQEFPFCVLSSRRYGSSSEKAAIPVASIMSRGYLNGAQCWPCRPVFMGEEAWKVSNDTSLGIGSMGPGSEPQLCNAHGEWEQDWEQVFDETAGPEFAAVRKRMGKRSVASCIRDMHLFMKQWDMWNVPPAELLCAGLNSTTKARGH